MSLKLISIGGISIEDTAIGLYLLDVISEEKSLFKLCDLFMATDPDVCGGFFHIFSIYDGIEQSFPAFGIGVSDEDVYLTLCFITFIWKFSIRRFEIYMPPFGK